MGGCLFPIYDPSENNTYVIDIYDSTIVQINVTMTDSFDVNAWSTYFYQDSYGFLGLGTATKTVYEFYHAFYHEFYHEFYREFYHEFYQGDQSLVMNWS